MTSLSYVYTLGAGMLFFYCLSAYIYYRLTRLILTKFEESFVHIDIGNVTKKVVFFYYVVLAIIGLAHRFLSENQPFFDLQHVFILLSFPFLWIKLPFKNNEFKSKFTVICHLVITPVLLTFSLLIGWASALTMVVHLVYA